MTFADPYPMYQALRSHGPFRSPAAGISTWILSGYADVAAALQDDRLVSTPQGTARRLVEAGRSGGGDALLGELLSRQIEVMNGPPHRHLRELLSIAMSRLDPADLAAVVDAHVATLLASVRGVERFDWVRRVAGPLPHEVLLDVLGLPEPDRVAFAQSVRVLLALLREEEPTDEHLREAGSAGACIVDLVRRLRASPPSAAPGRLVDRLVATAAELDDVTDVELAANLVLLFAAGHGTTTSLVSNALYLWLRLDPAARPDDAAARGRFVEEALRYESPIQSVRRVARSPIAVANGEIEPDDEVLLLLGAANRDPRRFADAARFVPHRPGPSNVAFGQGIHRCPGAKLARLQMSRVLEALAREPARLRAIDDDADWPDAVSYRGLRSLDVRWAT